MHFMILTYPLRPDNSPHNDLARLRCAAGSCTEKCQLVGATQHQASPTKQLQSPKLPKGGVLLRRPVTSRGPLKDRHFLSPHDSPIGREVLSEQLLRSLEIDLW